jgi:dihydrofolate synthase / folylpolyglutamate synthase
MNYSEAVSYLYGLERFGIKLGLENTLSLLDFLGNPHLKFPSIHIAGTNGKGSVSAILGSILCHSDYKTGLYTSPHLVDFRERIRICGRWIEGDFILDFVNNLKRKIEKEQYTFFEVTTALAFSYFALKEIDIGVIETGLGGRLDSTNVILPEVAIITTINYDHTDKLGTTLQQIAFEKGGIIKSGVPTVVMAEQKEVLNVLKSICRKRKSKLIHIEDAARWEINKSSILGSVFSFECDSIRYENLKLNLAGSHQIKNAVASLTAIEELKNKGWKIEKNGVREGLKKVDWRGRLEIFQKKPLVLLDVAHNPEGAKILVDSLKKMIPSKRITFIFGVVEGKDYPKMLSILKDYSHLIILTQPKYPKMISPKLLAEELEKKKANYKVIPEIKEAFEFANEKTKSSDAICITGSHFTVGEFLEIFEKNLPQNTQCECILRSVNTGKPQRIALGRRRSPRS